MLSDAIEPRDLTVPQGVLNATGYSGEEGEGGLDGLIEKIYLVWADDVVLWRHTGE